MYFHLHKWKQSPNYMFIGNFTLLLKSSAYTIHYICEYILFNCHNIFLKRWKQKCIIIYIEYKIWFIKFDVLCRPKKTLQCNGLNSIKVWVSYSKLLALVVCFAYRLFGQTNTCTLYSISAQISHVAIKCTNNFWIPIFLIICLRTDHCGQRRSRPGKIILAKWTMPFVKSNEKCY